MSVAVMPVAAMRSRRPDLRQTRLAIDPPTHDSEHIRTDHERNAKDAEARTGAVSLLRRRDYVNKPLHDRSPRFRSKSRRDPCMPRTLEDFAVFAAPAVFVVLWASGFIGAKLGLRYVEPMTFLALRMIALVVLLGAVIVVTRPKWPTGAGALHSVLTGLMVHGLYLGGVFASIENGLSAAVVALVVSLQPVLTSTLANRWLGERVALRQWLGLVLGLAGVYLIVRENIAAGEATPLACGAATLALIGITVGTLYQKRFGGGIDWRTGMWLQYAASAVFFSLGAFAFETRVVHWTPELLFALCWLIFVLSFGAIWLLYFLIRRSAATRVVSLFYLTPPLTALMTWLWFGERLAPLALAGLAICVAGVFLVNWRAGGAAA
jgi:drug/metabolite transporter (DMT)-like permease